MKVNNKKLIIICLIFSLLIPTAIILNFIKFIPNETNEKRNTLPKLSNQNINITTPENKTYTAPMSGYYPATYGFENDEDGSKPHNWSVSEVGGIIQIIGKKDGHNKVAEIHETSDSLNELENRFSAPQTTGIVEYYFMVNRIDDSHDVGTIGNGTSYEARLQIIVGSDGYLKYLNYLQQWINIISIEANRWYHMRIKFDCSDDWHLWLDGISQDGGSGYTYVGTPNSFDRLKFRSSNAGPWKDAYIWTDAIGYSWDPNYYLGDNLCEGLLLSFDNSTNLDWIGYSLDKEANRTILGNATIPMPEDGLHTIQIFGNDSSGIIHQSDVRYFSVNFPIDIITPEAITYRKAMDSYYPGTFGFEETITGMQPSYCDYAAGGTSPDGPGSYAKVIDNWTDGVGNVHKKVLKIYDRTSSGTAQTLLNFTNEGSEVCRNCTVEFWACNTNTGNYYHSYFEIHGDLGNMVSFEWDSGGTTNDPEIRITPATGEFGTGVYHEWNRWYRYSIDISCDGGYAGLGTNEFRFRIYNETGDLIYASADLDLLTSHPTGGPYRYHVLSTQSQSDVSHYLDGFGITGLQDNYEIGDNLNEGLLLSYENSTNLDWIGYSLDGQANKTILGNNTIKIPQDGAHTIKVYGKNSSGNIFHSNLRHFSVHHINIQTPEDKTYTEPMSGYYPATYGFENTKNGSIPEDWIFSSNDPTGDGESFVIDEVDGHKNVIKLKHGGTSGTGTTLSAPNFNPNQILVGTIEWWMYYKDNQLNHGSYVSIGKLFPWGSSAIVGLKGDGSVMYFNGAIKLFYGTGTYDLDTWHHFKVDLDCSTDKYNLTVDGTTIVSNIDFVDNLDYINHLHIGSDTLSNCTGYYDAFGYSSEPGYNIGDNIYEGLLLGFENSTALNWTEYSLDYQPMKTILGNTTFPMPENGLHTIQVFGNDSFGTNYNSEIRHFTVDYHPLKIITPENKTYTEPMSGFYPATYGFENDDNGVFPFGWIDESFGSALVTIEEEKSGHKKVIKSYDPAGSSRAQANQSFSHQLSGSIEFWFLKEAGGTGSPVQILLNGDNGNAIHLLIDDSSIGNVFYASNYGEFAAGKYSDDQWFHIKIDFNCSTDKYDLYLDGVKEIDQGDFENTQNWFHYFYISSSNSRTGIYYIDALGYSWDPNYNIGDNLNEGLLLSFENSTNLDWMGYSLDSQPNKTILGNTTFPMPENGLHTIQVFGNDTFGTDYQTDIRYFTVHIPCNISIITPENKTYTEPMSEYYPAVFGFENQLSGVMPNDWIIYGSSGAGYLRTVDELDGHKKVLDFYSGANGDHCYYEKDLKMNVTNGTIEFWFQTTDVSPPTWYSWFMLSDGISTSERNIRLCIRDDTLTFANGTDYLLVDPIVSNQWYHLRIDFNMIANTSTIYLNNVLKLSNVDNWGNGSQINTLHVSNHYNLANTHLYLDAIGYSWDPYYIIGDNLNEGLLFSYENSTDLDWIVYSIDGQTNKTILGNTTIPMINEGLHSIQMFGNDTFGTDYQSDVRYFTFHIPRNISIITPENKTYTGPMSGYYPATYGFENDEEGTFPNDWYIDETPGCTCEIIESFDNHKKIVNITDTIYSNQANMINNLSNRDNGTIEFYYRIDDASKRNTFSLYETDSNDGIYLRVDSGYLQYRTGAYYDIIPILNNRWYHISITFNSTIDKFWVVIDGTSYGGTSGYDYYSSNAMMKHFKIASSIYHDSYSFYIDAIGYSWDSNYNIGENLNEGLLLSYNISGNLDWMGYSLDGQANKTILGNTTIPMPGNGVHTIQVFGTDTFGTDYESDVRYFTIDLSIADTISPVITILSPSSDALFGNAPPDFSISIVESNLHLIWYTMDGGITNFFITVLNGTINQDMWNSRPNGLNTIRFSANDTMANLGSSENTIEKDTAEPIITINSPNEGETFTITPPTFSLSINESHLDLIWYTIDEGPNSIFCSNSGQIDDQLWLVLEPEEHILHFYANDTLSNVGFNEVIIVKGEVVPVVTFEQHYSPFFIFLIIAVGLVGLIWFINKKYK